MSVSSHNYSCARMRVSQVRSINYIYICESAILPPLSCQKGVFRATWKPPSLRAGILCDLNKMAHVHIMCAILICATTAKAKHMRMCDNLISAHQNNARGKQLALLKYSHREVQLSPRMYVTQLYSLPCLQKRVWLQTITFVPGNYTRYTELCAFKNLVVQLVSRVRNTRRAQVSSSKPTLPRYIQYQS